MAEKQYKCPICGATFGSQPELEEHSKKEHAKEMHKKSESEMHSQ